MDTWTVAPGFEAVADTLAEQAAADAAYSAQVCVKVKGRTAIDAWVGPDIDQNSMVCLFSSSKGLSGLCMALLTQRGRLDLDQRVAEYWPEFAQAGKDDITVRTVLTHQAGLPEVDGGLLWKDLIDGHAADRLAAQRPLWRPGASFGYHAATLGVIMDELCRRTTGDSIQSFYEQEIRTVASNAEAFLGLPAEYEARVVAVPFPELPGDTATKVDQGQLMDLIAGLAVDPESYTQLTHTRQARALGLPALGGVGSARGLAQVYSTAVIGSDEPPLLSPDTVAQFGQIHADGTDVCSGMNHRFGIIFQKPLPRRPFASYQAIGHDGAGGSLAFADPQVGMAFGFITNRLAPPGGEPRADQLALSARACILGG